MKIEMMLNGRKVIDDIPADTVLLDWLRSKGCLSVKRGCETANCGLCTVLMDGHPILSCGMLAARASGHIITTLEGLQDEARTFASFMAAQGADQCGFCNPGFVMNVLAMEKELHNPTESEIRAYLAGNLCRCTGFVSQHRAIAAWLASRREEARS